MRLASKLAINEKSTIFVQFWWNFAKSSHKWAIQLVKVWSRLDKNCGILMPVSFFMNQSLLFSVCDWSSFKPQTIEKQ